MAGQEALGRVLNIIPVASGQPFKMRESSAVMFVLTGTTATSVSLTNQPGFAGTPVALSAIRDVYWASANNGTAGWNKTIQSPAVATYTNSGINAAATCTAFHVFTSELTDPNNYLTVTAGGAGVISLVAIVYDLVHQRGPANLPILAA